MVLDFASPIGRCTVELGEWMRIVAQKAWSVCAVLWHCGTVAPLTTPWAGVITISAMEGCVCDMEGGGSRWISARRSAVSKAGEAVKRASHSTAQYTIQ